MLICRHTLRTSYLITNRGALNHFNRTSNSLLKDDNGLKVSINNFHQTGRLEKFNFISNLTYGIKMKFQEYTFSGSQMQLASIYLMESSTDKIDCLKWIEYFEMKDSVSSWFLITMLHNWMILVRLTQSDKRSEYFKSQLIKRQWEDYSARISKLGHFPAKQKRRFINDCSLGFHAALVAYDEGLINTDRELAASLWRTFFQYECPDYTKLEVLVAYVRAQLQHLTTIKDEDLLLEKHIEWKKFDFPK